MARRETHEQAEARRARQKEAEEEAIMNRRLAERLTFGEGKDLSDNVAEFQVKLEESKQTKEETDRLLEDLASKEQKDVEKEVHNLEEQKQDLDAERLKLMTELDRLEVKKRKLDRELILFTEDGRHSNWDAAVEGTEQAERELKEAEEELQHWKEAREVSIYGDIMEDLDWQAMWDLRDDFFWDSWDRSRPGPYGYTGR